MFRNYFQVALRNLKRNKVFSFINIVGLAVGIAVFLLIIEFVGFEWGSNRFHTNYDRIYRAFVINKTNPPESALPPGVVPMFKEKFTDIDQSTRVVSNIGDGVISYNDNRNPVKSFREPKILYVDGNFFDVFSFPLLSGTPSLSEPNTMAISESNAKKIFGITDVVGKSLTWNDQFGTTPYTITAVFKDMPSNSDIKSELLLSFKTLENPANRDGNDWADPKGTSSSFVSAYVLLKKEADAATTGKNLSGLFKSIKEDFKDDSIALQPMAEMHLAPGFNYPFDTYGSLPLVLLLLGVALVILFIAWVNYINLSTVQALKRAKETGVRKVLGASRSQLSIQYLSETLLLTFASAGIAVVLVYFFQPIFNDFTGKDLSLTRLGVSFWTGSIIFILFGCLLSGGYVAFVLSSFKPIATIRGKIANLSGGLSLRKGLVVFQFSVSIIFIIATIIMYRQLRYMKTSDSGLKLDQILVVNAPAISTDGQAEKNIAFKEAIRQQAFVKKYSASNGLPGTGYNFNSEGITSQQPGTGDDKKSYSMLITDNNFFDLYHIKFVQGKSYTQEQAYDGWRKSLKVVINEKAARQLGFPTNESLVGKKILWGKEYEIVGVVKDYHHLSMKQAIDPMIFLPSAGFAVFSMEMSRDNMRNKISAINKLYSQYFPGNPFDYFFADEEYNKQFTADDKIGKVFVVAAMIAIMIACLGLFGLAAFTTQQLVKEIGIRKVLGASVVSIAQLLSKDFLKLVFISICIATPIAWWAMSKWLTDFAYRTSITWWIFGIAGIAAIGIAILTVSYQAIRAATANPVNSLRAE